MKAFVRGWVNYFAASTMAKFVRRTDEWLRRRIRQIYWKQWKKVRTKFAALRKLGADDRVAWEWANTRKSYWHTANSWILSTSLTNDRLRNLGWTCLGDVYKYCGSARWVVWKGLRTESPHPYPIGSLREPLFVTDLISWPEA